MIDHNQLKGFTLENPEIVRMINMKLGDKSVVLFYNPKGAALLIKISDFDPISKYTPFNYVVKDVKEVRARLERNGVTVSEIRNGEPKRFDLTDNNGNMISVIQL